VRSHLRHEKDNEALELRDFLLLGDLTATDPGKAAPLSLLKLVAR